MISLIILTLLAILVVSFISTATLERNTAKAFVNKASAEVVAQTGVNQAISLLAEKVAEYPDSATVWEPIRVTRGTPEPFSEEVVEGTMLYMNERMNQAGSIRHVLPLMSRGNSVDGMPITETCRADQKNSARLFMDGWNNANSIDLNRPRYSGDTEGWIGPTPDGRRPYRARWVDVYESDPVPGASELPKTIARYAFWMEDESFKVNLNMLGDTRRGVEKVARDPNATAIPIETAAAIPVHGLLRAAKAPFATDTTLLQASSEVKTRRETWIGRRFFDLASFNQVDIARFTSTPSIPYPLGDRTKFLATIYSGGLNMSRHGTHRVNLNGLGLETSTTNGTTIMQQLNRIVETIRHHTNIYNDSLGDSFGNRFYRLVSVPSTTDRETIISNRQHRTIYLYKLAANIRDYIDPDLQPTILRAPLPGTDRPIPAPATAPIEAFNSENGGGPNEIWAQGKDSGLFLPEAVVRYRTRIPSIGRYELQVDYYIEFWNMGTKDIYCSTPPNNPDRVEPVALGPGAFIRIADQQPWISSGGTLREDNGVAPIQSPSRDLIMYLTPGPNAPIYHQGIQVPGVVFKAGQCTIITTDPNFASRQTGNSPLFSGGMNIPNLYYTTNISGKRLYTGSLRSSGSPNSGDRFHPDFRDSSTEDYSTQVVLGTSNGYIESHGACISMGGGELPTQGVGDNREFWYGGTLFGNSSTPSQLGDPRTNNEMLVYTRHMLGASTSQPDQARYFNQVTPPRFSLGYPNDLYLSPAPDPYASGYQYWPDYYKGWRKTNPPSGMPVNPNNLTAPGFYANSNLASIGQLGDIIDPARVVGNRGSLGIGGSRGGGRTLRIGQSDSIGATGLVNIDTFSRQSQLWAAWRLTDFFDTTSELYQPGLININGLRRDNGAALRAACEGMQLTGFKFASSDTGPTTYVKDVETKYNATARFGIQNLITQAINRLSITDLNRPSYFRERGEISELDIFSANTSTSANNSRIIDGINMAETNDRGREELIRRLMGMITTRGNVFSVYAIGQTIAQKDINSPKYVTGEHRMKVTFALLPRNADGTEFGAKLTNGKESFDPLVAASRTERFAKPDHYDIQLLQVETP